MWCSLSEFLVIVCDSFRNSLLRLSKICDLEFSKVYCYSNFLFATDMSQILHKHTFISLLWNYFSNIVKFSAVFRVFMHFPLFAILTQSDSDTCWPLFSLSYHDDILWNDSKIMIPDHQLLKLKHVLEKIPYKESKTIKSVKDNDCERTLYFSKLFLC